MKRKNQNRVIHKYHMDGSIIVQTIISLVSTLIVLFTLFEMQAERNAAYRPSLSVSNTEIAFAWDTEKKLLNIDEIPVDIANFIEDTTTVNQAPKIGIQNIGVGTAKTVEFKWNNDVNINQFVQALEKYCDINITKDGNGMLIIENGTIRIGISPPSKTTFEFVLNSTENKYSIVFPDIYYYLMSQLCSHIPLSEFDVQFYLTVTYFDIQGKSYSEIITLTPKPCFSVYNTDDSGVGIYSLVSEENDTMEHLNNINNDTLIAVTSVFAVVISIISIIFTTIFSILQIKHNKNSIRPISSIQVSDYENLLAVCIFNVGTGPLTITKLRAFNDNVESPSLIELMPNIDQDWSTFIESADGWTLPVGGKIELIEIEPQNDFIKRSIRSSLSKITISLEYADIYNTKFHDERKLDFFGRHTE